MKKVSTLIEHCLTSDVNPGNSATLGVTNHLTPINNILTNIRNLYADVPIVVAIAEDGVSIKVHSSRFVNRQECDKILYFGNVYRPALATYIMQQGLDKINYVDLGQYIVVYFSATDIKAATPGLEAAPANEPDPINTPNTAAADDKKDDKKKTKKVKEGGEINNNDKEIIVEGSDDDKELTDITRSKLIELLKSDDKVKSAKQVEILVGQEMELPREFYFAGLESSGEDGECIALRWKYQKRVDVNATAEITKTLIKFHAPGEKAVCVPDFDKKSMFNMPDEIKKLIENILEFADAHETDDPAVYSIEDTEGGDDKKDDKTNDKNDDKTSDKKEEGSEGGEDNKNKGGDLLS